MQMDWTRFERVIAAETLEEVQSAVSLFCSAAGFEHHGLAMRQHPLMLATDADGFLAFNNYGNEWGAMYAHLRSPRVAAADARVGHSRTSLPALTWNVHGNVAYNSSRHRKLYGEGQRMMAHSGEFGIRGGITAPCRGRGLAWGFLSATTDRTHDIRELMQPLAELSYFVSCMQVALEHALATPAKNFPVASLTPREREVLAWCAIGKTSWEIGVILGISERTVNFHVYQAADKLVTRGRQSTVARAVALGLVQP